MAGLLELRDALAELGSADVRQLGAQLDLPASLLEAMLARLEAMGRVERVAAEASCGACRGCAEASCAPPRYRLKTS